MNFTILVEAYLLTMYMYFLLHIEVESQRWIFKDMIIRYIYPSIWQLELHPNTRILDPVAMNFTILVEVSSWQCTQFVCMPNSKRERFLPNQWIFTRCQWSPMWTFDLERMNFTILLTLLIIITYFDFLLFTSKVERVFKHCIHFMELILTINCLWDKWSCILQLSSPLPTDATL